MTVPVLRTATPTSYNLAEGIIFDHHADLVRWVDITAGRVFSGKLRDGLIVDTAHVELGQTVGAVAMAHDGGLLVAAARGLAVIAPDGETSFGPDIVAAGRNARLNDGSIDSDGRFVVGTLSLGSPDGRETLLRVSAEGIVETLREGIGLSNGIGFSPGGDLIYHVDTLAGTVASHSYGPGEFDHQEPWVDFLHTDTPFPDGLTVSSDGTIWTAHWGGGRVCRYSPEGALLETIAVPASQPTCPAFVGPALDILAVTSAQDGLEHWDDQSGALFLIDVDVVGLPSPRWTGSTRLPYWHIAAR